MQLICRICSLLNNTSIPTVSCNKIKSLSAGLSLKSYGSLIIKPMSKSYSVWPPLPTQHKKTAGQQEGAHG